MKYLKLLLIALIALNFTSCIDEEGEGGIAEVHGYVYKVLHPNDNYPTIKFITDTITNDSIEFTRGDTIFTYKMGMYLYYSYRTKKDSIFITKADTIFRTDTIPAAKEDVYIVYGNEPIYGDKMETGYDGYYRFKYLNKGTYKIFAYNTLPSTQKIAVIDTVTVKKGESKQVRNIYIHEGKSYETSYIKGTVNVRYYNKTYITGWVAANDVRVYIKSKNSLYHFDEVRTGLNGTFIFQNLPIGDYEVFVLTEAPGQKTLTPISQSVSVTEKGVIVTMHTTFKIIINS